MPSGAISATPWPIQRSVLDRPVLADTTDPVVAAFVVAYDEAVETLGECTPDHPRCAARALSAAHAAEYAAFLADQHAAGWPDMASTRICADPWMGVGWT